MNNKLQILLYFWLSLWCSNTALCLRIEHARLHEKHKGHEAMHTEMVLILIATLVVAQILLMQWKQRYFRSYQVGMISIIWIFHQDVDSNRVSKFCPFRDHITENTFAPTRCASVKLIQPPPPPHTHTHQTKNKNKQCLIKQNFTFGPAFSIWPMHAV